VSAPHAPSRSAEARQIARPAPDEYPAYARMYVDLLPEGVTLLRHMAAQVAETRELVESLPPRMLLHRYAAGKWTVKQVLVHVVDDERIYAYRALRFARGDATELPGFEQDDYAALSGADERDVRGILAEYEAVRRATVALFDGLPDEAFDRAGVANGNRVTVRALAWHIAGHELHHLNLIRSRYLAR
jgi:uncharacterized damage-inducible protein DinB